MNNKPIVVLGAGSWGTALAIALARNGNRTHLWGHIADEMHDMATTRVNTIYLPNCPFPDLITVYTDLRQALEDVDDILIVVPSHAFPSMLQRLATLLTPQHRIAWATKGLHPQSAELLQTEVMHYVKDDTPLAVLSGPTFAKEVGAGMHSAITCASNNEVFAKDFQQRLHSEYFRVYLSDDMVGVQLCGAVKNVLAIATGIVDGMKLGANTRAALITRGLAEMMRLGIAMGAEQLTFMGLAGLGDLVLTCTDNQSRNRRFGLAVGRGQSIPKILNVIGQVVEGMHNAEQVVSLAKRFDVEMPICEQVQHIINQKVTPQQAVHVLFSRDPKSSEF